MRSYSLLIIMAITAGTLFADTTANLLPCPPEASSTAACNPSKRDLKQATTAFSRGLKLQNQKHTDEAFEQFEIAARLEPRNVNYLTARELAREQSVFEHIQAGNAESLDGKEAESLANFRAALNVDPKNEFALERVKDALAESTPTGREHARVVEESTEIRAIPDQTRLDFHYRGDSRGLLTQVAGAFHIEVIMDDSVASRPVRFDIEGVDFSTAMSAAGAVTHTFWTPMGAKQILVAAETLDNHRLYDRMAMRTFYIPGVSTPTDLTNVTNVLRNIFDIRLITPHTETGTLTVRAPQNILDAATQFIENLDDSRPEVMLDVKIYQVSHTYMRTIGVSLPNQFTLVNIGTVLVALGGQNLQSLINQLIATGGINQANNQTINSLLAQLQGQGNSIFSTPLATFGGGKTFSGVSLGTLVAEASLNESWARDLQHSTLRISQGNDATLHLGTKYPILNATFAPVFNTPAIAQVLGNNTFQAPFPSFSYEDIGLSLKAKPMVNGDSDVSLTIEMQVRSLAGQAVNGVPIISNREYKGSVTLLDGEPAVVAGEMSHSEQRSLTGIPGFGQIPGFTQIEGSHSNQAEDDDLLIVLTPHVVRKSQRNESAEIWITK
jgi:general secretion pathway protein D